VVTFFRGRRTHERIPTVIHLIGPGGAGKTTTGAALADRFGVPFVDLDAEFAASCGDISTYLDMHGHDGYAAPNARVYSALTRVAEPFRVVALWPLSVALPKLVSLGAAGRKVETDAPRR
jgi:hypothetical protein